MDPNILPNDSDSSWSDSDSDDFVVLNNFHSEGKTIVFDQSDDESDESPIRDIEPEEELSKSYQSSPEDSLHSKEGPINEVLSTELSNDEVAFENLSREHVQIESIKEPIEPQINSEEKIQQEETEYEPLIDQKSQKLVENCTQIGVDMAVINKLKEIFVERHSSKQKLQALILKNQENEALKQFYGAFVDEIDKFISELFETMKEIEAGSKDSYDLEFLRRDFVKSTKFLAEKVDEFLVNFEEKSLKLESEDNFEDAPEAPEEENLDETSKFLKLCLKTGIDKTVVDKIETLFIEASASRQSLDNKKLLLENNPNFVSKDDKENFDSAYKTFVSGMEEISGTFWKTLEGIENGQLDKFELEFIRRDFVKNSPASPDKIQVFLASCETIVERINFFSPLYYHKIIRIFKRSDFELLKSRKSDKTLYLFSFSFAKFYQTTEFRDNFNLLLKISEDSKSNDLFAMVDVDLVPEILNSEKFSETPKISIVENGAYSCTDMLQEIKKMNDRCLVEFSGQAFFQDSKDYKRRPICIPCPLSFGNSCPSTPHQWICNSCNTPIEYGFDERFYCTCGSKDIYSYNFKCNSPSHGPLFQLYDKAHLLSQLSKIQPRKEINILILGETGVGKSTWINAIAAYLTFASADEAISPTSQFMNLIPTKFTLVETVENQLQKVDIKTGVSKNERSVDGKSCTKSCRAYQFAYGDYLIRIIDTPGIGDTGGLEQDKKNIENIMYFVDKYKIIHSICILLKPNESKLTDSFEYCFKELLTQFHRSAANNIVFCFTNTSGYGFNVAETLTPLQTLLKELNEKMGISIALDPTTAYCFDNMAYRYLCAKQPKYNVNFSPDREALYQQSYRISRDQTCRLIDYVLSLQPHNASDSLSIFSARNTIFRLNDPLVKISTAVQRTIQKIQDRQEMVNRCHGDIRQLRKILKNRIKLIRWKIDTNERIVCTNCKVKKCYYGDDRMQFLEVNPKVMDKDPFEVTVYKNLNVDEHGNMTCSECGPNYKCWKSVGQEWYTSFEEFKEEENPTVASQISARQKTQDDVNQQLREEEQLRKELSQERNFIVEASAKFAHFLKKYSMTTYNDAAERYLKKLIEKEEKIGVDESKLKSYVDLLERLINQKELLEKALKNPLKFGRAEITPADVHELVEQLKKLKHYGKDIEDALNREVVVMTGREFAEDYNGYVDGYLPFQYNVKIKKAWKVFKNYIF